MVPLTIPPMTDIKPGPASGRLFNFCLTTQSQQVFDHFGGKLP
jgi:hypothetical protein